MGLFSRRKKTEDSVAPEGAPSEDTFRALDEDESAFIAGQLTRLDDMSIDIGDPVAIGAAYDRLLADWAAAPEDERSNPTPLINLIGVALGQHLVQVAAMEWGIASDEFGVDLALRDEKTDWMTYPISSVAKRWAEQEEGSFIPEFVDWIVSKIS